MAKRVDANLTVAKNDDEAINYFIIAFKFFLQKHTWKTLIILGIIGLSLVMLFQRRILETVGYSKSQRPHTTIQQSK